MHLRAHPRLALSALAAVLASVVVTGCTGGDDPAPNPSGSAASGSADPSNAPLERAEDGLPVGFPRDAVPVVEGQVLSATEPTKASRAYTVLIGLPDSSPEQAKQQAVGLLEDAGWEPVGGSGSSGTDAQLLNKDANQVIVLVGEQRGNTAITYSVRLST